MTEPQSLHHLWWLISSGLLAYAELHYKFLFGLSSYFQKEPEIIFDAPHRLEENHALPIYLIINDAHLFPIFLHRVIISGTNEHQINFSKIFTIENSIEDPIKEFIFNIDLPTTGYWEITAQTEITLNKKFKFISIDNYPQLKKTPFTVVCSGQNFPKFSQQFHTELHYHSRYTFDQLEFGAGLQVTQQMASAVGLDVVCLTDHSYDLDDKIDNYLINDESLPKWNQLLNECDQLNQSTLPLLIPGFELSTGNNQNKNVHLLLYGQRSFIPGSGDSGEKWFQTQPETLVAQVLPTLDKQTAPYAAHPFEPVSLLQSILLGRGNYSSEEISELELPVQLLNGRLDSVFEKSKQRWIELLLSGKRIPFGSGNDAHGNFNRYRQVKFPFISLEAHQDQIFGFFRTVVQSSSKNEHEILNSLKNGHTYSTNGVALQLDFQETPILFHTNIQKSDVMKLKLFIMSSIEMGTLENLFIYIGSGKGEKRETIYLSSISENFCFDQLTVDYRDALYFRLEVFTNKNKMAMTNPIYLIG